MNREFPAPREIRRPISDSQDFQAWDGLEFPMDDAGNEGASPGRSRPPEDPAWSTDKLERARALEEFRASGQLSEAEFEEQKAKLRLAKR